MNVTREDLHTAAGDAGLTAGQADALWAALEARTAGRARFDVAHVLYYAGAALVVGAMGLLMSLNWNALRGGAVLGLSVLYGGVLLALGRRLQARGGALRTAGGVCISTAVAMVPLAIYGFERLVGWWSDADGAPTLSGWLRSGRMLIELGTLVAALVALRVYRVSLTVALAVLAGWVVAMELTRVVVIGGGLSNSNAFNHVSIAFGLAVIAGAYLVDRKAREDVTLWGYLSGLVIFWVALSTLPPRGELGRLLYCLINLGLVFSAVILRRRAFLVFGALGVAGYLVHLAESVFRDTTMFPIALSAIGLAVIAGGVTVQRRSEAIERALPDWLLRVRPPKRE